MRPRLLSLLVVVTATACVPVGGQTIDEVDLAPTFAPATESTSGTDRSPAATDADTGGPTTTDAGAPATDPSVTPEAPDPSPAATSSPTTAPTEVMPPTPRRGSSTVTEARNDRTRTVEPSPDWADLAEATLLREDDRFTRTVGFGAPAPTTSGSGDHTMNVASFYDVDGDGYIDFEVWANLADGGWDTAYWDNTGDGSAFSDDDEVDVAVTDGRLVLTFPATLVADAWQLRWAVASEYGRYEVLGTSLTARDDLPDDDRPAPFPA
jgi:hypothetical protein